MQFLISLILYENVSVLSQERLIRIWCTEKEKKQQWPATQLFLISHMNASSLDELPSPGKGFSLLGMTMTLKLNRKDLFDFLWSKGLPSYPPTNRYHLYIMKSHYLVISKLQVIRNLTNIAQKEEIPRGSNSLKI